MNSLRVRLALSVMLASVVLIGALGAVLYAQVSSMITADFDARLATHARVLSELVEFDAEDGLEYELQPVAASFGGSVSGATGWALTDRQGTLVAGDASIARLASPQGAAAPTIRAVRTDDGTAARVAELPFTARGDDGATAGPPLRLTVLRATDDIDALLRAIASLFWLFGAATCLLVGSVAAWQVSRGLAPMRRLAERLAEGDAEAGAVVEVAALPTELRPFGTRTNALLQRLGEALEREREFSGHVAHELRTPLSILKTGLEIATRRLAGDARRIPEARQTLGELSQTVQEMSTLVSNLLTLVRVERSAATTRLEPVVVRQVVDTVWRRLASRATQRGLTFDNQIPPTFVVQADLGKLHIIAQNLLANAVSYTERGGRIEVSGSASAPLRVWDSGPALTASELGRVFDRLWRADQARTDATEHAGLGLSLARALARHMRMELTASNGAQGGLCFTVERRDWRRSAFG